MEPTQTKTENTIIRRVKVDRTRTPQEVLDAISRKQYVDPDVLATMPQGEGEEVEVYFFKLGRWVSHEELAREYEARGLTPDPYAQAQVNAEDPAFADDHPNATQWDVKDGVSSFVAFDRWRVERDVRVSCGDGGWSDFWWFAGVRKK